MRKILYCLTAIFGVLLFAGAPAQAGADCLEYEPATVKLTGTISQQAFPGPPNYESIRKGDSREVSWILNLQQPICTNASQNDPDLNPARQKILRVQLVLDADKCRKYRPLLGTQVVATGTLFGQHTAHHRTPVLLTVQSIDKPK